jgi:AmiR/NasT family two-component response regulator
MDSPEPSSTSQDRIDALEQQSDVDRQMISHLEDQGVIDRTQIAHLQVALVTCRRIGAAIGILMSSSKLTEDAAFELLRARSQHGHRKLRDIADEVVLIGALSEDLPASI